MRKWARVAAELLGGGMENGRFGSPASKNRRIWLRNRSTWCQNSKWDRHRNVVVPLLIEEGTSEVARAKAPAFITLGPVFYRFAQLCFSRSVLSQGLTQNDRADGFSADRFGLIRRTFKFLPRALSDLQKCWSCKNYLYVYFEIERTHFRCAINGGNLRYSHSYRHTDLLP